MDFDGYRLLMEQDFREYVKWEKDHKNMSLKQLKESSEKWRKKMGYARENYEYDKEGGEHDVSKFMASMTYFYHLCMIWWSTLDAYTLKLEEENKKLTKSKKTPTKTRARKKSTKK